MSKNKIGPNSPWVFGKGKELKQAMGSGKNAEALLSALDGTISRVPSGSYPATIFQDELATRTANAAQPAQAVLGDFTETLADGTVKNGSYLPAVINEPPRSYPSQIFQDDAFKTRSGTQAVFGGSDYLPAVVQNADDAARPAMGMVDDVVNPIVNQGVKAGTKIAAGITAGLPGVMDIVMPEYANAGENGFDLRNEIARREQHKVASDQELARMLGISAPNNYIEANDMGGRSIAGSTNGNGLPSGEGSKATSQPSINSQSQPARSNSNNSSGGRFMNAGRVIGNKASPEDAYRELIQQQMDGIQANSANKSAFNYLDLSPLHAFVDNMTGSNLSQTYKGPKESAERDMNNVNSLGKQLADYDAKKRDRDIELQKALLARQGRMSDYDKIMMRHNLSMQGINKPFNQKELYKVREDLSKNDLADSLRKQSEFNKMLTDYYGAVNKIEGDQSVWTGEERSELERLHKQVQLYYKEHEAKLGAITGPDKGFMDAVLASPTGFEGGIQQLKGGVPAILSGIKEFQTRSKDKSAEYLDELRSIYPPEVVNEILGKYQQRIDNMKSGGEVDNSRSPAQTSSKKASTNSDLANRVKAALEKAKSSKAK